MFLSNSKVMKELMEMINRELTQARNLQPLSGSTTFSRIENPSSRDPLNGLYIGAHGLSTSEVIQLRRKYGQFNEDGGSRDPSNIEFYEYVEAVKLTGDRYVPAGEAKRLLTWLAVRTMLHSGVPPFWAGRRSNSPCNHEIRINESFDGVEEGYDSSKDEISSVSSYNLSKDDIHRSFGSSLSLADERKGSGIMFLAGPPTVEVMLVL